MSPGFYLFISLYTSYFLLIRPIYWFLLGQYFSCQSGTPPLAAPHGPHLEKLKSTAIGHSISLEERKIFIAVHTFARQLMFCSGYEAKWLIYGWMELIYI